MTLNLVEQLRKRPAHEVARLIGCAPQYITDSNFINLLNQYNLNINIKDKMAQRQDMLLSRQFDMFENIPGLKEQVAKWLSS